MAKQAGERVSYRTYTMVYGLTVDDSTGCVEKVRNGTVTSVQKNHVKVRDDGSGRIVNVLHHRIVGR
jgi:hypothetical protein